MKEWRWLKSLLVGQFEFWSGQENTTCGTPKFIALREDKQARDVRRE